MANATLLQGRCRTPFLDVSLFPRDGGNFDARLCAPDTTLPGNPICCLPCPASDWTYSDNFKTYSTAAEWLNVVGVVLMTFMLLSYSVLPAQETRSHYLSVCLLVSETMMAIGFIIPLGAQPEQCYNEITPNDMYSSAECAWSGAFITAGGLSTTMWILIRALSTNLQICWDIVPGRKFLYLSQALGWGIPAALFTTTIVVTGVSFRFGNACHVNHENSMADFWGPLIAIAAGAGILQLMTFAYCIRVYLNNIRTDDAHAWTNASGSVHTQSYNGNVRTQTARAVYSRLEKVLWLQWRGICIATILLGDEIFFSIVFVYLDNVQSSIPKNMHKLEPWLECLVSHPRDKDQCLHLVSDWLVSEPTVLAVLMLFGLAGIQLFVFLIRPTIFSAWAELLCSKVLRRQEPHSGYAGDQTMTRSNSEQGLVECEGLYTHDNIMFEMQRPGVGIDGGSRRVNGLASPDRKRMT